MPKVVVTENQRDTGLTSTGGGTVVTQTGIATSLIEATILQPKYNILDLCSRRLLVVQKRAILGIVRQPEFELYPIESIGSKAIPNAGFGRVD